MTSDEDTAMIAGQLAELTKTVEQMGNQLRSLRESSEGHRLRAETEHERMDLAAKELAEVSARLQAAAAALRQPT